MRHIVMREFEKVPREAFGKRTLTRLQVFDERHARSAGECVFDWSRIHTIQARNYVGVVQVPGLTVEILPKIDDGQDGESGLAQRNLLYMLSFTQELPLRERDLAQLASHKLPLLETLMRLFVDRLLTELKRGVDHRYIYKEENARFLRGKLLISKHIQCNAAHKERLYVGFEEFLPDTWLNRVLKAGCRRMLSMSNNLRTQQRLSEVLVCLAEVEDRMIRPHHFDRVQINRNNQRYEMLVGFAKMVLLGEAAAPEAGGEPTFSLLFPMESLFEQFIARFIKRYADEIGVDPMGIHIQAKRRRKHLVLKEDGQRCFWLKPDILIQSTQWSGITILDTKWKRLKGVGSGSLSSVALADVYQLYGYADRYEADQSILLYPRADDSVPQRFMMDRDTKQHMRIEFVELRRDLRTCSGQLREELRDIFKRSGISASADI